MEETQNILLNSSINKKSINENASLNIAFSGNKRLLPEDAINGTIDAYNVYLSEREKSNKFRLIFNINPICSNILFNPFTEIVKYEGSSSAMCLNYLSGVSAHTTAITTPGSVIVKDDDFEWSQYQAIRDTQLSNEKCGFDYHCGIDIFNNHILRSKSFKTVNYNSGYSSNIIGRLSDAYGENYDSSRVNERAYTMNIDDDGAVSYEAHDEHFHNYLVNKDFNTIDDYMRDKNGVIISEQFNAVRRFVRLVNGNPLSETRSIVMPLHLYQSYDINSFDECVNEKLSEDNGWYGFSNPSNLDSLIRNNELEISSSMNINKAINNRLYCDFIDMYPGRDLYSFVPRYNKLRKRIEKNWQYFITYPSRSVIRNGEEKEGNLGSNFPFFRYGSDQFSRNISLKAYMIDEGTFNDYGEYVLTVYSVCQHGLVVGDTVNIYKSDDLFYDSAEVINIVDKYIFQVIKDTGNMSDKWVEFRKRFTNGVAENLEGDDRIEEDGEAPSRQAIYNGVFIYGNKYYPICESNRCNIDDNAQDIHFRRVVNGVECKYYVRKFSRLPNFKFKDEEVNDYTLYDDYYVKNKRKDGLTLIERFSKPGNENTFNVNKKPINFESHISKLGFANTSYNDDSVEIVFTDDIDTSYLKDNLGRPLSDIYLTIVKNNMGYKKWYGIGEEVNVQDYEIEYSHCFGKINSSFVLSDYFREFYKASATNSYLFDVRDLSVGDDIRGLKNGETDEIAFDKDYEYYGDICCYSPVDCDEQVIQTAMHRFNTAQRELYLSGGKSISGFNYGVLYHDEIRDTEDNLTYEDSNGGDPYQAFNDGSENPVKSVDINSSDRRLYHTTREEYSNMLSFKEGYYYQPHYRVAIKDVSKSLSTDNSIKYELTSIILSGKTEEDRQLFILKTLIDNNFLKNEKVVLYKRSSNEYFYVTVYDLLASYAFKCVIADENGNHLSEIEGIDDISDFVILKKHNETPSYAKLIKDGSCRYCWREIISNGLEKNEKAYPFTNGAFYITKRINFFLRRQGEETYNTSSYYSYPDFYYVPKEERIIDYPNFNFIDDINYEPNEIREC